MMSKLKLQVAESAMPGMAMSCVRAERSEAASAAQAEGENSGRDDERAEAAGGSKRQARSSPVKPVRAMSCMCAEQREAACATQAEGEKGGGDDDGAEAAGGECDAC